MSTVIAALDSSLAARPVLETAVRLGALTGAGVEAVHVHDGTTETVEALAARSGIALHVGQGPVVPAVLAALARPDALMAVVGARATPGGRRPVGGTALRIVQQASKPVVVIPPDAVGRAGRPIRRLLVPLEGTETSSAPVVDVLRPILPPEVELVVVHVFTSATVPKVLDDPVRDLLILGDEFLARNLPGATDVAFRTGPISAGIADMCAEEDADMVVLSWCQDASAGRAQVVRDVLARSALPVVLLPCQPPDVVDIRGERAEASAPLG